MTNFDEPLGPQLLVHLAWLKRLARSLVGNDARADDLVQETWVAALQRPPALDRPVRPWLAQVLLNVVRSRARSAGRRTRREQAAALPDPVPTPEQLVSEHDQLQELASLVRELDEPYRSTVLLCYGQGLSPSEVAQRLGVPAGTVRWRLKEALGQLRRKLDRRHGERARWRAILAPIAGGAGSRSGRPEPVAGYPSLSRGRALSGTRWWTITLGLAMLTLGWVALRSSGARRDVTAGHAGGAPPIPNGSPASRSTIAAAVPRSLPLPGETSLTLSGTVLDPTGAAVHAARLRLWDLDVSSADEAAREVPTSAGRYSLRLPPGQYRLEARADGYVPTLEEVALARDQVRDLHVPVAAPLTGRVVIASTGQPLAGADVTAREPAIAMTQRQWRARTDSDGRFTFRELPVRSYQLVAHAGALAGIASQIAVTAGGPTDVGVIHVLPAASVRGRVLSPDGAPAQGARVGLVHPWSRSGGFELATIVGADGAFQLTGVLPGQYRLEARHGSRQVITDVEVGAQDQSEVTLKLASSTTIRGRVTDAHERPVRGALVMSSAGKTFSSDDGTFALELPARGSTSLLVSHTTAGAALFATIDLFTAAPEPVPIKLAPGFFVTGRVRGNDDTGVADVRVAAAVVRPAVSPHLYATTDARGGFRLGPFPADIVLEVSTHRQSRVAFLIGAALPARPGQQRVRVPQQGDLVLSTGAGGGTIAGRVLGAHGRPVAGAAVLAAEQLVTGADGHDPTRWTRVPRLTRDDGTFLFEELTTTTHALRVVHPDHAEEIVPDVPVGTSGLSIRLTPGAQLSGLVVGSDDRPVTDYVASVVPRPLPGESAAAHARRRLQLEQEGAAPSLPVRAQDGRFLLRRLRPGPYELLIRTPFGSWGKSLVTLEPGRKPADLRVVVDAGIVVQGTIVDALAGTPLSGVTVETSGFASLAVRTTTDQRGQFSLGGVPSDRPVRLRVSPGSQLIGEMLEQDVDPTTGVVQVAPLRLVRGRWDQVMGEDSSRGLLGLRQRTRNGLTIVESVRPGLAADRAGIRAGDRIVQVNGLDVRALGEGAISYLILGRRDEAVALTIEDPRTKGVRFVTLRPAPPVEAPPP
jgi:RNA polymerase sigma factor (sigma-70 family)